MTEDGPRWVFGYGSLMWRPGFDFVERRAAVLHGMHRAFCIYSVHHRGTRERPGLVLGLVPGGAVLGAAYRVDEARWREVHAYLLEREQPTETYLAKHTEVELETRERVKALTFLSDIAHPQWAGDLDAEAQARLIAGARGLSGRNVDYLSDLVTHLRAVDVADPYMEALLARVQELEARTPRP